MTREEKIINLKMEIDDHEFWIPRMCNEKKIAFRRRSLKRARKELSELLGPILPNNINDDRPDAW